MKKKTYISGPITGIAYEDAVAAFSAAEKRLNRAGITDVVNPVTLCPQDEGKRWEDYMSRCLAEIPYCGSIYMLRGWERSRGARVELATARELGLGIWEQ